MRKQQLLATAATKLMLLYNTLITYPQLVAHPRIWRAGGRRKNTKIRHSPGDSAGVWQDQALVYIHLTPRSLCTTVITVRCVALATVAGGYLQLSNCVR